MALRRVLRRVAVVGEGADRPQPICVHQRLQLVQLVLGQRLGGEQVQARAPGSASSRLSTGRL